MRALLKLCGAIDAVNRTIGRIVGWGVLVSVIVSAGNATIRYTFDISSNAWLELQWYLFSAVFLLCAPFTHLRNEHIRIDIISSRFSKRTQTWIDIFGGIVFLLPMSCLIAWLSIHLAWESFIRDEISGNAGGLTRWPVKILVPIGFLLLSLQGLSEVIKRFGFLYGYGPDPTEVAKPQSSHAAEGGAS